MKTLLIALLMLPSVAAATLFEDFVDFYKEEIVFVQPPNLCKLEMTDESEKFALCFDIVLPSQGPRPFRIVHRDGVIEKLMTPKDDQYPEGEVNPEQLMRASTI